MILLYYCTWVLFWGICTLLVQFKLTIVFSLDYISEEKKNSTYFLLN